MFYCLMKISSFFFFTVYCLVRGCVYMLLGTGIYVGAELGSVYESRCFLRG